MACECSSGAASGLLVLAIDGHVQGWATTIGFGVSLGAMSGFWEICYGEYTTNAPLLIWPRMLLSRAACGIAGILLADVFGLEILGTINGTLSTFGLCGMALGPVVMSLLYEYSGQSFRLPLLILASANAIGAAAMACVVSAQTQASHRL